MFLKKKYSVVRFIAILGTYLIVQVSNAQVSLQTGSATFSLPMFNWQDNKSRLTSIVALSYNSGNGLRVNEVASNVGQGWNLIAGGQINRMQVGEPDDQPARAGNGKDNDVSKYPPGILYATVPAANGCPKALNRYPIFSSKNEFYAQHNRNVEDRELDYFSFQFNGKAGVFVLNTDSIGKAFLLGDSKMKITFVIDSGLISQGIRTRITSFTIQDVDGLKYKFAEHNLTKVLKLYYCDGDWNYKQKQPKKFQDDKVYFQKGFEDAVVVNPWVISGWYLTEIEDPLTGRKVLLNYTARRDLNNIAGEDITANQSNKNYCTVTRRMSVTKTADIDSIVFPDGHVVKMNYGGNRIDFNGGKILASVDVKYQNRYISKYELNTTYFILNRYGTPVSDYQKRVARLCLKSVRKIGVDLKEDTPPYKFDYYTGSNTADDFVPPPFFHAKDIWGFFNGDNSKGNYYESIDLNKPITKLGYQRLKGLCFRRYDLTDPVLNAKTGYAKNGLLRQIIYPTGGTLTYNYAQNTGIVTGSSEINVGGVHVSSTSSTDGGNSNNCSNPIVTNYNYVLNGSTASSLWGLEMPRNAVTNHNHYKPEWKTWHYGLGTGLFGECYWHFRYPGIMTQQQVINLTGAQQFMQSMSTVFGIISILGTVQDFLTVLNNGSPVFLIIDIIVGIVQVAVTCIGDQARNNSGTVHFNYDLNSVAPLPTQFKRVEVVEGTGSSGKTIQEFTNSDDYSIWESSNPYYTAKQRFASWAYGLPKKTLILDASSNKIKETINTYDYTYAKTILNYCEGSGGHGMPCNSSGLTTRLVSCNCKVERNQSERNTLWTDPATHNPGYLISSNDTIKVDFYGMYTGRTLLSSTAEKIYKQSDQSQYVESIVSYAYNNGSGNNNYEPHTITTMQSNGDYNFKTIKYSPDYSGGSLSTLVQNNILTVPVETRTSVYKVGGSTTLYLNEQVTEFSQLSNGDIKPSRILEQRFNQPTDASSITFYQGPGSSISQYKIPQAFTYNSSGDLIGVKDEGGRSITNIYDYNEKYIIATIINAEQITDKPAYTSFETDAGFGNWVVSGTPVYSTTSAITDTRSFTLSSGKSLSVSNLNTSKAYLVSFWSTGTGITVSTGSTLSTSGPTLNGFTYYEYLISQGTSSVTIAGSGTLDELRLYPRSSRMNTVTYDPVIGKTSECDQNNRITYYEYDNVGRLQFVKDEKKNIVKAYEYNNISEGKQNGCPGTYYNKLISEVFTRNNCSSGYRGGDTTFSVAANTYSSTLSQEDADAQAEHYLLSNGQSFANSNASCSLIYYNTAISDTVVTQNCPFGYVGGAVIYTVPAARYSSIISQADADQMAQDDLEANAEAYANDPATLICTPDTNPQWVWLEGADSRCDYVSGVLHRFIQQTDMNPSSSTYLETRWKDAGEDSTCTAPSCNTSNCTGNAYKCIYGFCEMGIKIYTSSFYDDDTDTYTCTYHYEWSDGSWSQDYTEYNNPSPCDIGL